MQNLLISVWRDSFAQGQSSLPPSNRPRTPRVPQTQSRRLHKFRQTGEQQLFLTKCYSLSHHQLSFCSNMQHTEPHERETALDGSTAKVAFTKMLLVDMNRLLIFLYHQILCRRSENSKLLHYQRVGFEPWNKCQAFCNDTGSHQACSETPSPLTRCY